MGTVCCTHTHHTWRYTEDAWQVRVLRFPLLWTKKRGRAERSRFVWGVDYRDTEPAVRVYTLSLLGILHGLFGIVLWIEE